METTSNQRKHSINIHSDDSSSTNAAVPGKQEPQTAGGCQSSLTYSQNPRHHTTTVEHSPQPASENENKWLILEGLKDGQRFEDKQPPFSGYILKRRKRPLKGWHKRYFHLENGILSYAKSSSDWSKKKLHGSTDIGLSVISYKVSSRRIDIDSDTCIFHLKAKKEDFKIWVNALRSHRLARQHEINYGNQASTLFTTDEFCDKFSNSQQKTPNLRSLSSKSDKTLSSDSFIHSPDMKYLSKIQEKLVKLSSLLKFIEVREKSSVDLEGFKYKKSRLKFHLRRKKPLKREDEIHSIDLSNVKDESNLINQSFLSVSHPSLAEDDEDADKFSTKSTEVADLQSLVNRAMTKDLAMHEFVQLANEINNNFRYLLKAFQEEQQKFNFNLQEKSLHSSSDLLGNHETSLGGNHGSPYHRTFSIDECSLMSNSEYHDAEDKTQSDYNSSSSSVEDDDDESVTDFSEIDQHPANQMVAKLPTINKINRRTKLPSVQPTNDISLWSLLYKNIGKDLSKISMPVTINEPLNLLQRLCEELEYCELLDMAATMDDPYQRMLMIAAFAISSYSSNYYRVGHKPFNPLLGETYECIREDKGFKFIAEQVSHHPPVSACYANSKNYIFWQDMRCKTKFWGKSMEIIPIGTVNVTLIPYKCHYKWNKITTCVHNLFKGERYVDIYGELIIQDSDNLTCKITFEKAGYWSNKVNEVHGYISNHKGEIIERIYGKWNESVHSGSRCIWRAGTMPENYESYYGFTRFAIELNELTDVERPFLPPTDTRFRPDQRLLEEGNINRAEEIKLDLEQRQRERRKIQEQKSLPEYTPLWFNKGTIDNEEIYTFNHKYWETRENKFNGIEFVELW